MFGDPGAPIEKVFCFNDTATTAIYTAHRYHDATNIS
jgi:hypothetical protein